MLEISHLEEHFKTGPRFDRVIDAICGRDLAVEGTFGYGQKATRYPGTRVEKEGSVMVKRAPYHDELASLMSKYRGQQFTAGEVRQLFREKHRDLRWDWVQASDHCIDHTCKDACPCAETDRALFSRPGWNTYIVL